MRRSIVLAFVVFGAAAGPVFAQDAKKGEQVYMDQKCSLCHSIAGKGNTKGPLDSVGTKLKAEEIRQWVVDPKTMAAKAKAERTPAMPVKTIEKEELDSLVAYLATLKKK